MNRDERGNPAVRGRSRALAFLGALLLAAAAHGAGDAGAATFKVKSGDNRGHGTLRAMVRRANRHPGHDRISFSSDLRRVLLRNDIRITDSLSLAVHSFPDFRPRIAGRPPGRDSDDFPRLRFGGKGDKELIVRSGRFRGVSISASDSVKVFGTRLSGAGGPSRPAYGIYVYGDAPSQIDRTEVRGFDTGILVRGSRPTTIKDTRASHNWTGVEFYRGSGRLLSSTVRGNRTGISGYRSHFAIVETNITDNGPLSGVSGGSARILRSTVARNVGEVGGGVLVSSALVRNSTISGNVATGSAVDEGRGGGVFVGPDGDLQLTATTVTDNSAAGSGGGIYDASQGDAAVASSIVAGNDAPAGADCSVAAPGVPPSQGGNVFGTEGCGDPRSSDILTADPGLGPLGDNGGTTQTHALLPGSPAIGNGLDLGLRIDQRGVPRGTDADSGSYEVPEP